MMYGWQLESLQKSKECCQGVPKQKIKERDGKMPLRTKVGTIMSLTECEI